MPTSLSPVSRNRIAAYRQDLQRHHDRPSYRYIGVRRDQLGGYRVQVDGRC
jgi:hypothetical protein